MTANDSSAPGIPATGEPCEHEKHVCPDCGETFADGTDYEDGDSCRACLDEWFSEFFTKWQPAIQAAAQLRQAKGKE